MPKNSKCIICKRLSFPIFDKVLLLHYINEVPVYICDDCLNKPILELIVSVEKAFGPAILGKGI